MMAVNEEADIYVKQQIKRPFHGFFSENYSACKAIEIAKGKHYIKPNRQKRDKYRSYVDFICQHDKRNHIKQRVFQRQ